MKCSSYKYNCNPLSGKRHLDFKSVVEFKQWKEREEEASYTTFVSRDRTYIPQGGGKHNVTVHV